MVSYSEDRLRNYLKISIAVIVLLALVIVYFFVAQPQIQGYVVKKQVEAQQIAVQTTIQTIMNLVKQQGYVQLGQGNESMILMQIKPEQLNQLVTANQAKVQS